MYTTPYFVLWTVEDDPKINFQLLVNCASTTADDVTH